MGGDVVQRAAITFVGFYLGGPGGAAGLTSALYATAVTFAISKAAEAMADEPDAERDGAGRRTSVRQEAAPRQIIYGEARVGGTYTYIEEGGNNRYLHIVLTLAGHEVEGIDEIYFDESVVFDASGSLSGSRYKGKRTTGDISVDGTNNRFVADQTATNPAFLADLNNPLFVGQIIRTSGFANAANNGLHRITDVVRDTTNNEHRVTVETNLTGEAETSASVHGDFAFLEKQLGASDQAANPELEKLQSDWTSDHRQRECPYLYVILRWDQDKFPGGVPNLSGIVRGKNDIRDPRDGTTKYTNNVALCVADYLQDTRFGLGAADSEINDAALIEAANVCDESVSLSGGGSEARYEIAGTISSGAKPVRNLERMRQAMAGDVIWSGGTWFVQAGAYRTPTFTLDEDDAVDAPQITTAVSRRELFNAVKGTFIGPKNNYTRASFPAVTNSTYEAADNGRRIWSNIELPLTDSPARAQRLAKIKLERVRQQISVVYPTTLRALKVRAGDVVNVTNTRMGWTDKPFEVVDWEFALRSEDDNPTIGVDLTLRETASTVFDWSSGEETTVDPAPDTDLPDAFAVGVPLNVAVASGDAQLYTKKDGTVASRIRVSWDEPDEGFVNAFEVQAKRSSDTDWEPVGKPEADDRQIFVWDVEDEVDYDVRIRTISPFLVRSDWVTVTNHTVIGKTAPPPDPDTFDVAALSDGTRYFTFSVASPPADLAGFEIRFIAGSSTDYSAMGPLTPQGRLVSSPYETNDVPSGVHSFGIKAVDTSGNYSTNALFIEQDLPLPRLAGVLIQRIEKSLGWPGTLNSMFKDTDDNLYAVAATDGTWGDLSGTTWGNAGPEWYSWTNRASPVSYETEVMDLGSDAAFTPRARTSAVGSITREMKTGTEADGGVTGSYVALAAVEGVRYIQIRVTVTGTTPVLRSLTVLLDGEVEETNRQDIDTSSESAVWFNRIATGHFQIAANDNTSSITRAQITAFQSITAPHGSSLESKTATVNGNPAAEFKIFDETGTLADATIDVELRGPKVA